MSKRELIDQELRKLTDKDLDRLLEFLHAIRGQNADSSISALIAQSSLAEDWLSPEEDAAWANL